jgi:hypothetical protein
MKKLIVFSLALSAVVFLNGCVASVGGGPKTEHRKPTLGQELSDLKMARDKEALTEAEYQTQKAKLLAEKSP